MSSAKVHPSCITEEYITLQVVNYLNICEWYFLKSTERLENFIKAEQFWQLPTNCALTIVKGQLVLSTGHKTVDLPSSFLELCTLEDTMSICTVSRQYVNAGVWLTCSEKWTSLNSIDIWAVSLFWSLSQGLPPSPPAEILQQNFLLPHASSSIVLVYRS